MSKNSKSLTQEQTNHVQLVEAACTMQSIHDDIPKDDKFLKDPDNPFIDNGEPSSERFDSMAHELNDKIKYLEKMMIDSGVLNKENYEELHSH